MEKKKQLCHPQKRKEILRVKNNDLKKITIEKKTSESNNAHNNPGKGLLNCD